METQARAPDLVLIGKAVVTLWPRLPRAEAVALKDGLVLAVGSARDVIGLAGPRTEIIEWRRQCIVPGFHDAHIHLAACAKRRLIVDCSPPAVSSIRQIQRAIKERALAVPRGAWIRAGNYDEFQLIEGRHPTRRDLDAAAPHHPVILEHRSLHACVLNGLALRLVGIDERVSPFPGTRIDIDPQTQAPTGLLYEHEEVFRRGAIPPLDESDLRSSLRQVFADLLSNGITSVHDASFTNGLREWGRFRDMLSGEGLQPRTGFMVGQSHLPDFVERGIGHGFGDEWLRVGQVKIMVTQANGSLHPTPEALEDQVRQAHQFGFPVAIHAVDESAICVAIQVSRRTGRPGARSLDRIEHCSLLPPPLLQQLAEAGLMVATHPGFLLHSGDRYLAEVESHLHGWLYPLRSLLSAGIAVGAGSDAPVSPAKPLEGIYAAVTRTSQKGGIVAEHEAISPKEALHLYTLGAAQICGERDRKGSIEPGKLADLVVLSSDITSDSFFDIKDTEVEMTILGGRVAWQKKTGAS